MGTILLVVLILMLLGAVPAWPHSRSWGYGPSGGLGLIGPERDEFLAYMAKNPSRWPATLLVCRTATPATSATS